MYAWLDVDPAAPATAADALALRQSFGHFTTGVCLVSTVAPDGKREGMTINSFASVSLTPPLLLWSVRDAARSAEVFIAARHFTLSILAADQAALASHFARPAPDKFNAFEDAFETGANGCPKLRRAVATFECRTWSRHAEGDHTILVGRVDASTQLPGLAPLVFSGGRMGSLWELAEQLPRPAPPQ